jgi:hypothetical protein
MWRRVDIVLTDVSEECIASIFRVQEKRRKIKGASVLAQAHAGSSLADFLIFLSTLKMETMFLRNVG